MSQVGRIRAPLTRTIQSANDLVLHGGQKQLNPLMRPRQKPRIVPRSPGQSRPRNPKILSRPDNIAEAPG